jgi:hypothetical protein
MHHEFTEQFNALRDEFRSLKTCIKIKGTQNEEALDKGCIAATMLNSTERSLRRDLLSASVSNQMSPFGSSASSHSFDGFEIAHTTRSSEPKITTASGSSVSEASLLCRTQRISDQDENSSDGTKVPPTSRKGHRKSREGCFNCKRRKIKVCIRLMFDALANLASVPRDPAGMRKLCKKEPELQLPSSKDIKSLTGIASLFFNPDCIYQSPRYTNNL